MNRIPYFLLRYAYSACRVAYLYYNQNELFPPRAWPLHDIAITSIVWCMAYKTEVEGVPYLAQ